jgi:hypothetical protein
MGRLIPVMLLALTGAVLGQELPNATVSKATLGTFAAFGTEVLADGVTTRVLYQRNYGEIVHAGVAGQIGRSLLGVGATGGVWYVLRRAHREGTARWFLRSVTAGEGCNVARQFAIVRTSRK